MPAGHPIDGGGALRRDPDPRSAELGYRLVPAARGAGPAAAAARTLTGWAFDGMGLDVVVLEVEVDDTPSLRVAERLGAVRAGDAPRTEVDRDGVTRALVRFELRR